MDKIEGRINGRYDIKRFISSDSGGKLIDSYDIVDAKNVRLRILPDSISLEKIEEISRKFILYSRLRHNNLLSDYRFDIFENFNQDEKERRYFFATESVDEEELIFYTSLKKRERLFVLESVIRAICYLHFMGVTYGRLSFSNCFIYRDKSGKLNVKLNDLASVMSLGNDNYNDFRHSEFFVGGREADNLTERSDVFSLGFFIFYLVSGVDYRQVSMDFSQLQLVNEKIADLIINATHSDPDRRIKDVLTLWNKLAELVEISTDFTDREYYEKIDFCASFVAHEDKVNWIQKRVEAQIENGIRNALFIRSRAGMGKTRFLNEINHRLRISGMQPYMAEVSKSKEGDNRYPTFSKLLRAMLSKNVISASVLERLGPDLFHLVPDFAEIQGIDLSEPETDEIYHQKITARFLALIQELSQKKSIVIIIDNVDKMQEEEQRLLSSIIKADFTKNPILILSVNDMPLSFQNIAMKQNTEALELEAFNYHDTVSYIKKTLHMDDAAKQLARAIIGICHGNPRIIEKTIIQLYAFGRIKVSESRIWEVENFDFTISDKEAKIMGYANLDEELLSFSDDARHIIKQLAVYSQRMDVFFAIRLSGLGGKRFNAAIDQILKSKIIIKSQSDWGNYYEFGDYRLAGLIYQKIDDEEKIELHRIAASTYEGAEISKRGAEFDSYVYHLVRSNQEDKAIEVLEDKARSMRDSHHNNVALDYYQYIYSLRSINTKGQKYIDIIRNIAKLKYKLGEIDKAEDFYAISAKVSKQLGYEDDEIELTLKLISIYLTQNKYSIAKDKLFYLNNEKSHLLKGKYRLRYSLLKLLLEDYTLDVEETRKLALDMLKSAREEKSPKYEAVSLIELARFDYRGEKPSKAVAKLEKAVKLLVKLNAPRELKEAYRLLAKIYLTYNIDMLKAENYLNLALDYVNKLNIPWESSKVYSELGRFYQVKGDFESAKKHYSIAERYAIKGGQTEALMITVIKILEIYLGQGNYEACEQQLVKFDDLFEHSKNYDNKEYYYCFMVLKAELYLEFGLMSYVNRLLYKVYNEGFEYLHSFYRFRYEVLHTKYRYTNYMLYGDKFEPSIFSELTAMVKSREDALFYQRVLLDFAVSSYVDEKKNVFKAIFRELQLMESDVMHLESEFKMGFIRAVNDRDYEAIKKYAEQVDYNLIQFSCCIYNVLADEELRRGRESLALAYYCEAIGQFFERLLTIPNEYRQMRLETDFCLKTIYKKISEIKGSSELTESLKDSHLLTESLKKQVLKDKNYIKTIKNEYKEKFGLSLFEWKDLVKSLNDDPASNVRKLVYFLTEYTYSQYGEIFILGDNGELIGGFSTDDCKVSEARDYVLGLILSSSDYLYSDRTSMNRGLDSMVMGEKANKTILVFPIGLSEYDASPYCKRFGDAKKIKTKTLAYVYLESTRIINNLNLNKYRAVIRNEGFMGLIVNDYNSSNKSSTDKLTGLLVRSQVKDRLAKLMDRNSDSKGKLVFSVLMIDIDHFKAVNDTYGHRRGDEVLSAVGSLLKKNVRSTDIVGRYGGEEFIIVLVNADRSDAMKKADKIRLAIERARILGEDRALTISLGSASYPEDGKQIDTLVERADKALYYSKNNGRNRVSLYDAVMDKTVIRYDKLVSVATLNTAENNRRMRSIIELITLISQDLPAEEKLRFALGVVLDILEGKEIIIVDGKGRVHSRQANDEKLYSGSAFITEDRLRDLILSAGEGSWVDWDAAADSDKTDLISSNWLSYVLSKLRKDGRDMGYVLVWSLIREREFEFTDFSYLTGVSPLIATILDI